MPLWRWEWFENIFKYWSFLLASQCGWTFLVQICVDLKGSDSIQNKAPSISSLTTPTRPSVALPALVKNKSFLSWASRPGNQSPFFPSCLSPDNLHSHLLLWPWRATKADWLAISINGALGFLRSLVCTALFWLGISITVLCVLAFLSPIYGAARQSWSFWCQSIQQRSLQRGNLELRIESEDHWKWVQLNSPWQCNAIHYVIMQSWHNAALQYKALKALQRRRSSGTSGSPLPSVHQAPLLITLLSLPLPTMPTMSIC